MKTKINEDTVMMDADSYKFGHCGMLPDDTNKVYTYYECRTGATFPETVFYGLKPYILELEAAMAYADTDAEKFAELVIEHGLDMDAQKWIKMRNQFNGRLPIIIRAVKEGTVVPVSNCLLDIENIGGKEYAWLTNYLETTLQRIWYPCTVATLSFNIKKLLKKFWEDTCDSLEGIDFYLHDFGSRACTCRQQAKIGGSAHLLNFRGTDTFIAIPSISNIYGYRAFPGYSVCATEHCIMCAEGEEGELNVASRLVKKYNKGILALVIDSFNWERFTTQYATLLKNDILNREGKVVFRPDSGDPCSVTLKVIENLASVFGYTTNAKGYKVLNPKVGVLWGDGIDITGIQSILQTLKFNSWAACNVAFGMGGHLLQRVHRDTQRCAFKSSYQERNGIGYDIFKRPIDMSKASKKGKLELLQSRTNFREFKTINVLDGYNPANWKPMLETIYTAETGYIDDGRDFDDIKQLVKSFE